MSAADAVASSISALALLVSFVALIHTIRTRRRQDVVQAPLVKWNLDRVREDEHRRVRGHVTIRLERRGVNTVKLVVTNEGGGIARDVMVRLEAEGESLFGSGDETEKMPWPELQPGQSFGLFVSGASHAEVGEAEVAWRDTDGEQRSYGLRMDLEEV